MAPRFGLSNGVLLAGAAAFAGPAGIAALLLVAGIADLGAGPGAAGLRLVLVGHVEAPW